MKLQLRVPERMRTTGWLLGVNNQGLPPTAQLRITHQVSCKINFMADNRLFKTTCDIPCDNYVKVCKKNWIQWLISFIVTEFLEGRPARQQIIHLRIWRQSIRLKTADNYVKILHSVSLVSHHKHKHRIDKANKYFQNRHIYFYITSNCYIYILRRQPIILHEFEKPCLDL